MKSQIDRSTEDAVRLCVRIGTAVDQLRAAAKPDLRVRRGWAAICNVLFGKAQHSAPAAVGRDVD